MSTMRQQPPQTGRIYGFRRFFWFRAMCWVVVFAFCGETIGLDVLRVRSAYAQHPFMPAPGTLLSVSPPSAVPLLKAISIQPDDPYKINFLVDGGTSAHVDPEEINRLTRYFLTFLTIPEKDLWVNLSPYESERIVNPDLERTVVGRDMLIQDYVLKQLAASMTYPEQEPGATFWQKMKTRVKEQYGAEIQMEMFNKVWVVPEKAVVYEREGAAFIAESWLKVMMEEDYVALRAIQGHQDTKTQGHQKKIKTGDMVTLTRELIIPELEREVNEGAHFAPLRQMFHALILALWFKQRLKQHLVSEIYADQRKISGITIDEKHIKEQVYDQYIQALKKGVYNYIKEDIDPATNSVMPRKYFSGGFRLDGSEQWLGVEPAPLFQSGLRRLSSQLGRHLSRFTLSLIPLGISKEMLLAVTLTAGLAAAPAVAQGVPSAAPFAPPAASPHVLVVDQVLGLDNRGADVTRAGSVLMKYVDAQDIRNLAGERNETTGETYDGEYLNANAEHIVDSAKQSIGQGIFNHDVERVTIAFQEEYDLTEDGDIGEEVIAKLNALEKNQTVAAAGAGEPPPEDREQKPRRDIKEGGSPAAPAPAVRPEPIRERPAVDRSVAPRKVAADSKTVQPLVKVAGAPPAVQPQVPAQPRVAAVADGSDPDKDKPLPRVEASRPAQRVAAAPALPRPAPAPVERVAPVAPVPVERPVVKPAATVRLDEARPAAQPVFARLDAGPRVSRASLDSTPPAATIPSAYSISTEILLRPVQGSLSAPAAGIVQGLNRSKLNYAVGDVIFRIENPELIRQRETLEDEQRIAQQKLGEVQALSARGSASSLEVASAEMEVRDLQRQLEQLSQSEAVQAVKAAQPLSVETWTVSNGMMVSPGMAALEYATRGVGRFSVQVPAHITHLARIGKITINGRPIRSMPRAQWELLSDGTRTQITFDVIPGGEISFRQPVQVNAEIFQPGNRFVDLRSIAGEIGTVAKIQRLAPPVIVAAPEGGVVNFLVQEGDVVSAGQPVADIAVGPLWREYHQTLMDYNGTQAKLDQITPTPGSSSHFSREELDRLQTQKASLYRKLQNLGTRMSHLQVTAGQDGIVASRAPSAVVPRGGELLRLRTGQAVIGDIHNAREAILVPDSMRVLPDDPVIVESPWGGRLPGRVTQVNQFPYSDEMSITGLQALQVVVEDPDYSLGENLPVRVILLADQQKNLVRQRLGQIDGGRQRAERLAGVDRTRPFRFESPRPVPASFRSAGETVSISIPMATAQGEAVSFADLVPQIANNDFLTRPMELDIIEKKAAEINPRSLHLEGGIRYVDGRLAVTGGFRGTFRNLTARALTGDALGSLVHFLGGELYRAITKQPQKERALAEVMTASAQAHLRVAVADHVFEGSQLLIKIGATQQRIAQLEQARQNLQLAKRILEDRQAGAFSTVDSMNDLDVQIENNEAEILRLKAEEQRLTMELNELRGLAGDRLEQNVAPRISWSGEFGSVSAQQQSAWLAILIGNPQDGILPENTPNQRLQEALVTQRITAQAMRLQGIDDGPILQVTNLIIPDQQGFAPLHSVVSSSVFNSGSVGQRSAALEFDIPIFDNQRKARAAIRDAQLEKAQAHLNNVERQVETELRRTVSQINSLSGQIRNAFGAYARRALVLQEKISRNDLFTPAQRIQELQALEQSWQQIVNLQAQYFEAEAALRRLGLLAQSESLVQPRQGGRQIVAAPAAVSARMPQAAVLPASLPSTEEGMLVVPTSPDDVIRRVAAGGSHRGFFVPGTISYRGLPGAPAANTWLRMQMSAAAAGLGSGGSGGAGGPAGGGATGASGRFSEPPQPGIRFASLSGGANAGDIRVAGDFATANDADFRNGPLGSFVEGLQDPNIFNRRDALRLLDELDGQQGFDQAVEHIVLNSSRPEIVQRLLIHMVNRDRPELGFFVRTINGAIQKDQPLLVDWSFQALKDLLLIHPEIMDSVSEDSSDLGPLEITRRIFVSYLLWDSHDSMARSRLLRSSYWDEDQLAQIGKYAQNHSDTDMQELGKLVYDEILRREAKRNIPQVFNLGPLDETTGTLFYGENSYDRFRGHLLRQANASFLETSPDWRRMREGGFLKPELLQRAAEAAEDLLNGAQSAQLPAVYRIPSGVRHQPLLAYIEGMGGLEEQKGYISRTENIAELARILDSSSPFRGEALDRLMATAQGRLLAMEVYLTANDSHVTGLIENRNWAEFLKSDIALIHDASSAEIIRLALNKMYAATRQEWTLNRILDTYGYCDIRSADDPRMPRGSMVNAQIDLMATRMAVDLLLDKANNRVIRWAGDTKLGSSELAFLELVRQKIEQADDPRSIRAYLERQLQGRNKHIARELINNRDRIAKDITVNNQELPKIRASTSYSLWGFAAVLLTGLLVWGRDHLLNRRARLAPVETLKRALRKQLSIEETAGSDAFSWDHRVTSIPEDVDPNVRESLERWRERVLRLADDRLPAEEVPMVFNNLLNDFFEVLRDNPYTPQLMLDPKKRDVLLNEKYRVIFSHVYALSVDTLDALANRSITSQRERLSIDIEVLEESMEYVRKFLIVLRSRQLIDNVMKYKYPDGHAYERIYPFLRRVLLYRPLWRKSESRIETELPALLIEGNQLIPNLYRHPDAIVRESRQLLKTAVKDARSLVDLGDRATQEGDRLRRFRSRLLMVMGTFSTFGGIFIALALGWFSPGISLTGLSLLALGFLNYWHTHLKHLSFPWIETMNFLKEKLQPQLKEALDDETFNLGDDISDPQERSLQLAIRQRQKQISAELRRADPAVDRVLIIPEEREDIPALEGYARSRRGTLFSDHSEVEVAQRNQYKGSGNAFLETMGSNRRRSGKKMFVFHRKDARSDQSSLDLAVANGYQRFLTDGGEGPEYVLVYDRDAFLGPIPAWNQAADIDLMATSVAMPNLLQRALLRMDWDDNGGVQVREILEKLPVRQMQEAARSGESRPSIYPYLDENYNLDNPDLEQFPVLLGIMAFSGRTVRLLERLMDELAANPSLRQQLIYLHLTSDILNVLLKKSRKDALEYLNRRLKREDIAEHYGDKGSARRALEQFYLLLFKIKEESSGLIINAFMPHPQAGKFLTLEGPTDTAQLRELLGDQTFYNRDISSSGDEPDYPFRVIAGGKRAGASEDSALVVRSEEERLSAADYLGEDPALSVPVPGGDRAVLTAAGAPETGTDLGGVDFAETSDAVEFKPVEGALPSSQDHSDLNRVPDLRLFQGFSYELLHYQPMLNPVEFFRK